MSDSSAWYASSRVRFLEAKGEAVVDQLASSATRDGWHVEEEQHQEWTASVDLLQSQLGPVHNERLDLLRDALASERVSEVSSLILEYNLRRRGLRMDAVLLCPGVVIVIEFKRSKAYAADKEQVLNYCINLSEFHEETQACCEKEGAIIVPVLALTGKSVRVPLERSSEFLPAPWGSILAEPIVCAGKDLEHALLHALTLRRKEGDIPLGSWLHSRFSPSSTIIDAAISLYGQHDVSAIETHAVPVEKIAACVNAVGAAVEDAKRENRNHIVIVSGTPGSGKTLVGLNITFDSRFRGDAVFVTGNAPLVEVLNEALKQSYKRSSRSGGLRIPSGYVHQDVKRVLANADFNIVKAHTFLARAGDATKSKDGSVFVFDEAQCTYEPSRY